MRGTAVTTQPLPEVDVNVTLTFIKQLDDSKVLVADADGRRFAIPQAWVAGPQPVFDAPEEHIPTGQAFYADWDPNGDLLTLVYLGDNRWAAIDPDGGHDDPAIPEIRTGTYDELAEALNISFIEPAFTVGEAAIIIRAALPDDAHDVFDETMTDLLSEPVEEGAGVDDPA